MNREQVTLELTKRALAAEEIIKKYMPEIYGPESTVLDAMNYSMQAGGKRLRPVMVLEAYRLFAGNDSEKQTGEDMAGAFAAALEMIHTYSLIHDDLPAMDNDDYRRGRLTSHKVYGEAMAILAGDGLLNFAYQTAAETLTVAGMEQRAARALQLLTIRPGISGMLGGQVIDIEMEQGKQKVTFESLCQMYEKKTSALISCALEMGCVLAGGSDKQRLEMKEIGRLVGLAFQVQDDILDVTGDEAKLGKPLHSDEKNQKITCATLLGLEAASRQVSVWSQDAIQRMEQLEVLNPDYDGFLSRLIAYLIDRDH